MILTAVLLILAGPARGEITLETVLTGLSGPVRVVAPKDDLRLFVVEQPGFIRVFDQDGTARDIFLDVSDKTLVSNERGLLGLAFPPDYAESGRFYISLTDNNPGTTTESQIWRYQVSANPDVADAASGELLLTLFQPASNHNGGHIEFGPDGMLYIGFGDGGGANDTANNAQNVGIWLGKMLRLDVSGPGAPAVPPDNPFVEQAPLDEIWALGLRNPWCFSFDRETGDLYIADVGQTRVEEVDVQPTASLGGENYGWRLMEGSECFNPITNCNDGSLILPAHEYLHGSGRCSISGGYVYRGTSIPAEQGAYFFGDYCTGEIWSLRWTESGGVSDVVDRTAELTRDIPIGSFQLSSFGQDGTGELYVIENGAGRVHRIVDANKNPGDVRSVGRLKGNW
jgi:glucose/arabinose dehydrogenase